ncbi:diacylglycerol kinase family protein [Candidatus Uhrbacteria bacterium]|nr:diacylglycerol kinase family protein [Candidatus Uhrbacteria bacterium]
MAKRNSFFSSLKHALRGIGVVSWTERNFRIQIIVGVLILCTAVIFQVRTWEFILLILLIASVLVLELFNSVIERMADGLKPRLQPIVRDIKDLMAGAVLVVAVTSVVIGFIIFAPYFQSLI